MQEIEIPQAVLEFANAHGYHCVQSVIYKGSTFFHASVGLDINQPTGLGEYISYTDGVCSFLSGEENTTILNYMLEQFAVVSDLQSDTDYYQDF